MSQYKPSSLIPSTLTQSYSIDATVVNDFRCQINGTSATTKYRLQIKQNNTASTSVYDSGIVTLPSPIYPVDYNGNPNEIIVPVPASSGMVNGTQYKWTMTSYWGGGTEAESETSYENVFYAYAAATLSIASIPSVVTTKDYTFVATCTQAQGIAVEKFGWRLVNASTGEFLVDTITNNNIYSSDVRLVYDSLFSGVDYEVMVKCWLANGTEVETPYSKFSVNYSIGPLTGDVVVAPTCDNGILIQWPTINFILGKATGDYSYVLRNYSCVKSYCIDLPEGSKVVFDNINTKQINIPSDSTHVISFWSDNSSTLKTIYEAVGTNVDGGILSVKITYQNSVFRLVVNDGGTTTTTPFYTSDAFSYWYVFAITPQAIYIYPYVSNRDGLYPSETLYPSNTLYPRGDTYVKGTPVKVNTFIPLDGVYHSATINGPQVTNYLWICRGTVPQAELAVLADISIQPNWTPSTILLAKFEQNLSGGNYDAESTLVRWMIYRQENDKSILKHVCNVGPQKSFVVDYGVTNQQQYIYYVFPDFEGGIGTPLNSAVVSTFWWDWTLFVCENGEIDGVYYVQDIYRFDLDVKSSVMGNNTTFNMLQNFTPYAKIQNSNANYWSGTITGLLGNCAVTYEDTIEQMKKIKSLSSDTRTKFLKDRKGNIYMVRINNPVTEQIADEYKEQQVSVSLGWVEIGDSSAASVVSDPNKLLESVDTSCN